VPLNQDYTMQTLRLEVFPSTPAANYQLQFFEPNNPLPKTRTLSAQQLSDFITTSQQHYEKGTSLETLGKQLFAWLNGQEQYLHGYQQNTLLQIPTSRDLKNLAWELLNNNGSYLCNNQNHPFTPLRLVTNNAYDVSPANRPLRLLFMASSPENSKQPLDFEHEEALILDATRASNLEFIVEESGSLTGLDEWIRAANNDSNCFDVVHLTGHAGFDGETPVFELEDDFGQKTLATADDIACVFTTYGRYPRLLFLSGCKTAQDGTALPSLCEALVVAGMPAVLGWATSVGDDIASFTAKTLYIPNQLEDTVLRV
jgi:CHAT domain-containing protein